MSDDQWRRSRRDETDDDFGPPLFGDATSELDDPSDRLSFGTSETGPLPHWTAPPTGQMPAIFTAETGEHETVAPPEAMADRTDDLDVWSSFSSDGPVWSDDPAPTGEIEAPVVARARAEGSAEFGDDPDAAPRRGPSRITIGTDPTEDRVGRPMPKGRQRGGRSDTPRGVATGAVARPAPGAPPSSGRDMPTAVAVGLMIAAVFVGALLLAPWAALAVVVVILALGAVEFFDKVAEKGYQPATVSGVAACAGLALGAYFEGLMTLPLVMVLALAATSLTFVAASGIESNPLPNVSITIIGVTWIGLLGSFAGLILAWSNVGVGTIDGRVITSVGTDTLFVVAVAVVANDVGALFIGSAAGRTPLRAWISPNKTVEGFLGGTIMTVLAMVVVGVSGRSDTWNSTGDLVILGIVVAIAAPLGDLTESMFKRNLDIKDFGSIVKGHGGVLDRFDGFLFTLPAVYYLVQVLEPWYS
jgi:phosphatidate cytidylyltransferase